MKLPTLFIALLLFLGSRGFSQSEGEHQFGILLGTGGGYSFPSIGNATTDFYSNVNWRGRVSAHVHLIAHGRLKNRPRLILLAGLSYHSFSYAEDYIDKSLGGLEYDRTFILLQHYLAPSIGNKVFLTNDKKVRLYVSASAAMLVHLLSTGREGTLGPRGTAAGIRPINFSLQQAIGFQMKRMDKASFYMEVFHNWLAIPVGQQTQVDTGLRYNQVGLGMGFIMHKKQK